MAMTSPDVDALLERWIGGDAEAGAEIYRRYLDRARQFALKLTRRPVDAEELAQEALVAGLEGLRAGRKPDRFTGWILGVVKNTTSRRFEATRRERPLPADTAVAGRRRRGPHTEAVQGEVEELLRKSVDAMPADLQEALRLRYAQGLRRDKVADRIGITTEAVDKRCQRALAQLREALSRHATTIVLEEPGSGEPEGIERLRPSFREVFRLCRLEGLSTGAAARKLGLPVQTVVERLRFACETLGVTPPL